MAEYYLSSFVDKLKYTVELFRNRFSISAIGKIYKIQPVLLNEYIKIQNELTFLNMASVKDLSSDKSNYNKHIFYGQIHNKLRHLNEEFYIVLKEDMPNSFFAIIRLLVEMATIVKYIQYVDHTYYLEFFKKSTIHYKDLREAIKKKNNKLVDDLLFPDWEDFSEISHIKEGSFALYSWAVVNKTGENIGETKNHSNYEMEHVPETSVMIASRNYLSDELKRIMVNRYFIYTQMILAEVRKNLEHC